MTTEQERSEHQLATMGTWCAFAVPLWIYSMQRKGMTAAERMERAKVCGDFIAYRGDAFYTDRRVEKNRELRAELLNCIAEGLACMAFCPGGVTAFGQKFEVKDG